MAKNRFSNDEEQTKRTVSKEELKKAIAIFNYIKPYRLQFILGMVMLFLSSIVFMVFPYLAGEMLDIAQGASKSPLTLPRMGGALVVVLVLQGSISYFRVMLFATVSEKGIADLRRDLYKKLIALPIVFFEQTRVGELVSRLTADVERLYSAFSITLAEFFRQIIILISGIIFLAATTPKLALIMLVTFPFIVVGAMVFGRSIRKLSKERQSAIADSNIIVAETTQAIMAVKSYTNEWYEYQRFERTLEEIVRIAMKYARGRAGFAVFIVSVLFGALFFIIWQGAVMVQTREITAGQLVAFVGYTAVIGGAIAGLGSFYTELIGAVGATERVREILERESEVVVKEGIKSIEKTRLAGNITYENVHFSYPTRSDVAILKGFNLSIQAGQKVALVGMSGAGKSTILQLLMRFYELKNGRILVDGRAIKEYELTDYRQNFAIVPQEVILFGGTIRENIAYGKPGASEAEIIAAAEQAYAWEFISKFPEGLNTLVGERGVKLSGGQRQRIAIARAILKNPAILILDEATSSLDAESEKKVQLALNNLIKNRTAIIIAHRLATIRDVDCIHVLENGVIIESGTHSELSEIEHGAYQALAKLQFES